MTMRKLLYLSLSIIAFTCISSCCSRDKAVDGTKAKYIFLFIGDGMSRSIIDMTESWLSYKEGKVGGAELTMSTFPVYGQSTTHSIDRHATCSAAAGTAIACGQKTKKNRVGTDAEGNTIENISEVLHEEGYRIALMSSSPVNHATEASFYAHNSSRNNFYDITLSIPATGYDFFAGSGFIQFYGKDGNQESSVEYLERNGYEVCCGIEEYNAVADTCKHMVLYQECFRDRSATDYEMNGRTPEKYITLSEMLECGMDFIGDDEPFFIMCEGGTIDWAAHLNRVMPTINAVIEFDDAVKVAYDFYLEHPDETLIVVTSDHGTGGVALGYGEWGRDYIYWDKIEKAWNDAGQCNEMSTEDNKALNDASTIGWTTVYHTGENVPVYAIGKGAEDFGGKIDNTEFKTIILGE